MDIPWGYQLSCSQLKHVKLDLYAKLHSTKITLSLAKVLTLNKNNSQLCYVDKMAPRSLAFQTHIMNTMKYMFCFSSQYSLDINVL